MRPELGSVAWPASRIGEAVEALGWRHAPSLPPALTHAGGVEVDEAATLAGLEAQRVQVAYADLGRLLCAGAPALIELPGTAGPQFLAVAGCRGDELHILDPALAVRAMPVTDACALLREPVAKRLARELEGVLAAGEVASRRRASVWAALLQEQLRSSVIDRCWLLRAPRAGGFWAGVRRARLSAPLALLTAAHAVQHVLLILSWWVLGASVLQGRSDVGWLLAWAFLLLSVVPFRALEQWSLASLAARLGVLLKQRLLEAILHLPLEDARRRGVGQLLGRVIESEAIESLLLGGGHVGLVAVVELAIAVPVLLAGAGGALQASLLGLWVLVALLICRSYWQRRQRWTRSRLQITDQLVEAMVGYRTRLAQEDPRCWHEEEDRTLAAYLEVSQPMDRQAALLKALVPRGWLLLGLATLAPVFVSGRASVGSLAVAVGGVLFVYRALWKLVRGLSDLADAAVAWKQVAFLWQAPAATAADVVGAPLPRGQAARSSDGAALVEARGLAFRYADRSTTVLDRCDLRVSPRQRILLEGVSGAGKSTLAALLGGVRVPDSGLLLLGGLDRHTLGLTAWRRRAVAAPQFHENHVFAGTFAFNLLLGRRWPPEPEDLALAQAVCVKLGLGDLLQRMPAGLMQMVGDAGWQLSHGERSRLYMARALLQEPDLLILDEGLGALDAETQAQCLRALLAEPRALIIIAHP